MAHRAVIYAIAQLSCTLYQRVTDGQTHISTIVTLHEFE